MDRYGGDYDVILVDWHNLAWFLQVETYQSSFVNISSCYVILVQEKYHVLFFDGFRKVCYTWTFTVSDLFPPPY